MSGFAIYGTAIESKTAGAQERLPIWQQEVRDEKGRRRLHGAFTGGFSAGYFNTVGSKEGWTPSQFKSSRSQKAQRDHQAKPEDFMDEEDIQDREDGIELVATAGPHDTQGTESSQRNIQRPKDSLDEILTGNDQPIGNDDIDLETIGYLILSKMGWKRGQAIGPKIATTIDVGTVNKSIELAPKPVTAIETPDLFANVRNHGLGYSGSILADNFSKELTTSVRLTNVDPSSAMLDAITRGKKRKLAMNLSGAASYDDEDDEDILRPRISVAYDRLDNKKKGSRESVSKQNSALSKIKRGRNFSLQVSSSSASSSSAPSRMLCQDGKPPLPGFTLSTTSQEFKIKIYPGPRVPNGYKPQISIEISSNRNIKQESGTNLSVNSRARLIGETPATGKSVFDFLTPDQRERIITTSGNANLPATKSEADTTDITTVIKKEEDVGNSSVLYSSVDQDIPVLTEDTAIGALNSHLLPYSEDQSKRSRYITYLRYEAGLDPSLPDPGKGRSYREWIHELQEFHKVAQMFQPLRGAIADRFTGSIAGLKNENAEGLVKLGSLRKETPQETAARLGNYGPQTVIETVFYPERLLCKRFGVKPPDVEEVSPQLINDTEPAFASNPNVAKTSSETVAVIVPERNDALEAPKAPVDLFQSIFGEDEDDDDEN